MFNCKGNHKHHIVYRTTCSVDGKYYIGIHSTNDLDDGYLGSGVHLRRAVEKHGKESFTREVVATADSRADLLEMEAQMVTEAVVKDPQSYNLSLGGRSTIDSMAQLDEQSFIEHQKKAGLKGAEAASHVRTRDWHSKGGKAAWEAPGGKEKLKRMQESRRIPVTVTKKDGTFVGEWGSLVDACRDLGVDKSNASKVMRGKAKSTLGLVFSESGGILR